MPPKIVVKSKPAAQNDEIQKKIDNFIERIKQDERFAPYLGSQVTNKKLGYHNIDIKSKTFLFLVLEQLKKSRNSSSTSSMIEDASYDGILADTEASINHEVLTPLAEKFLFNKITQSVPNTAERIGILTEVYNRVIHYYSNILLKNMKDRALEVNPTKKKVDKKEVTTSVLYETIISREKELKENAEQYYIYKYLRNFYAEIYKLDTNLQKNPDTVTLAAAVAAAPSVRVEKSIQEASRSLGQKPLSRTQSFFRGQKILPELDKKQAKTEESALLPKDSQEPETSCGSCCKIM